MVHAALRQALHTGVITALGVGFAAPGCRGSEQTPKPQIPTSAPTPQKAPPDPAPVREEPAPGPSPGPQQNLAFDGACDPGDRIVVAAVGDVLLHRELQKQAYRARREVGFTDLWADVVPLLRDADLAYANLEGPTAPGIDEEGKRRRDPGRRYDGRVYTEYVQFNYHPSLAADLARSGIDVVSTANNHSLDRHAIGVDLTLDVLDAAGLAHAGTRRAGTQDPLYTLVEQDGFRLAWLACTMHTNYMEDTGDQVQGCFDDEGQALIEEVSRLADRADVDAVIVTPHFGQEYVHEPEDRQRQMAHALLEAGATAVIGSHPHVLQPWERYVTRDGRQTVALYSLGNFVSKMRTLPRRATVVLYLGLVRSPQGEVRVDGVGYVPLHMHRDGRRYALRVAEDGTDETAEIRTHIEGILGAERRLTAAAAPAVVRDCALEAGPERAPDGPSPGPDGDPGSAPSAKPTAPGFPAGM